MDRKFLPQRIAALLPWTPLPSPLSKGLKIGMGVGLVLAVGGLLVFWQVGRRLSCVRTVSTGGGQEILYVWGCLHPQRFRQWSITASAEAPRLHLRPTDPGQNFSAFPGSRW